MGSGGTRDAGARGGGAGRGGTESSGGWRSQKDAGDLHWELTMLRDSSDTVSNLRKGVRTEKLSASP